MDKFNRFDPSDTHLSPPIEPPMIPALDPIYAQPILLPLESTLRELELERRTAAEIDSTQARVEAELRPSTRSRGATSVVSNGPADGSVSTILGRNDHEIGNGPPEFGTNTHVFFANGINTSFERAGVGGTMLAAHIHQPVDLVYVRTEGQDTDLKTALHQTLDPEHGKRNPPEHALAGGIVAALDRGEDVHVVGFSRGALVTQLALESVGDH